MGDKKNNKVVFIVFFLIYLQGQKKNLIFHKFYLNLLKIHSIVDGLCLEFMHLHVPKIKIKSK